MKQLLYIFPVLLLSCELPYAQSTSGVLSDSIGTSVEAALPDTVAVEVEVALSSPDSLDDLHAFRNFSESYTPPTVGIAKLPDTPIDVLHAIRSVKASQPKEFERYLTLIFLKLYSAHLECCHQSYEIRKQPALGIDENRDPLVYEFNTLTQYYPVGKPVEFIPSSIGFDYVESHPYLLDFAPIKQQVDLINKVHANIENGTYWK